MVFVFVNWSLKAERTLAVKVYTFLTLMPLVKFTSVCCDLQFCIVL